MGGRGGAGGYGAGIVDNLGEQQIVHQHNHQVLTAVGIGTVIREPYRPASRACARRTSGP